MFRCRMFRHGAHHVNRRSLSGSTCRPTSTSPCPSIFSISSRSSGSCPTIGLRSTGCTSTNVRATLKSPHSTRCFPLACSAPAHASSSRKNTIFAAKSLPPFGTYTLANTISPTFATTIRFSRSNGGCTNAGRSPNFAVRSSSATPEYPPAPWKCA